MMKKLLFILAISLMSIATVVNAQTVDKAVKRDFRSGQTVLIAVPNDPTLLYYEWTVESGNVQLANQSLTSAKITGSGDYVFVYHAVYSNFYHRVTHSGKVSN